MKIIHCSSYMYVSSVIWQIMQILNWRNKLLKCSWAWVCCCYALFSPKCDQQPVSPLRGNPTHHENWPNDQVSKVNYLTLVLKNDQSAYKLKVKEPHCSKGPHAVTFKPNSTETSKCKKKIQFNGFKSAKWNGCKMNKL